MTVKIVLLVLLGVVFLINFKICECQFFGTGLGIGFGGGYGRGFAGGIGQGFGGGIGPGFGRGYGPPQPYPPPNAYGGGGFGQGYWPGYGRGYGTGYGLRFEGYPFYRRYYGGGLFLGR